MTASNVYFQLAQLVPVRFAVAAFVLALAALSHAEPVTFSAEINGAARVAKIDTQKVDGIEYVPLIDLVEQLGGGYNLQLGGVQIDMGGRRSYVQANERRIKGSASLFELSLPVIRVDGNFLIARHDVLTFCSRGFEVSVSDQEGPTASVPISGATQPADAAIAKVPSVAAPTRNLIRNVKTVIIDPGHGGLDHGVTGGGLDESELSLEIAKTLRNALADAGFSVVLTREESVNRSVVDRAKLANDHHGDLLIALHAGSSFAPNAHGIEVFYPTLGSGNADAARSETQQAAALAHPYTDRSQRFAQLVAGALSDAASAEVRGIHGARLRLHRSADMPGILLEMGVLTNPADGALLEKDSYRQSIVKGIVTAVQQFNDETGDS